MFGDSKTLVFDWRNPRYREPKEEILDRFLGIKTDNDVEDFARVYGALGLCCHGLPYRHPFVTSMRKEGRFPFKKDPDACRPLDRKVLGKWQFGESINAWFAWVETGRAILAAHAALRNRGLLPQGRNVLRTLYEPGHPFDYYLESYPGLRRKEREKIPPHKLPALWANLWLGLSGVTFRCGLDGDVAHLVPCAPACPLLGFLSLQLAQVLCGAKRMALCAACGNPCAPLRITEGRNSYCSKHRDQGRFKISKIRARERARRIHELMLQGRSIGQIAKELAIKESRVRTLIERDAR